MLHPDTELRIKNQEIGYGVFASNFIPIGTIVYIMDALEILIPPGHPKINDPSYKDVLETYSYIDPDGNFILSWDLAKYINHCCHCNILSTGYGFEIAIRDIKDGEEITDDYGAFNFKKQIDLICNHKDCRKLIKSDDLDQYHLFWDVRIKKALEKFKNVDQPLLKYMDCKTHADLFEYLETGENYRSVYALKNNNGQTSGLK